MINNHFSKFYHEIIDQRIWCKLPDIAKAVYLVLLRHAHITTKVCMPTQKTIAKESGIHIGSVPKAIEILEKYKLIRTWMDLWHGKRRLHYQILDPEGGIIPLETDIYPKKKRQIKTMRNPKTGRFTSNAIQESIRGIIPTQSEVRISDSNGSRGISPFQTEVGTSVPNGYKREILKKNNKEIDNKDNKPLSNNKTDTKPDWVTSDLGAYGFFPVAYKQGLFEKYGDKPAKEKLLKAMIKFDFITKRAESEDNSPLTNGELAKITEYIDSLEIKKGS